MHTDEYEISLGREIAFCRKMVRQLQELLDRQAKQGGMTTDAFLQALEAGSLSEPRHLQTWTRQYQEWQYWQKSLAEYEAALDSLKWL
jgi:hypothetical protein